MKHTMIYLLVFVAAATGCKKNKAPEYRYYEGQVTHTIGTNAASLGETLTLSAVSQATRYDTFHEFVVKENGPDTTVVIMMIKNPANQKNVTYELHHIRADYLFQPKKRGTHFLKFLSSREKGTYVTDTITVN